VTVNACTLLPFCSIEPLNVSVASVATVVGDVTLLDSETHADTHSTDSTMARSRAEYTVRERHDL